MKRWIDIAALAAIATAAFVVGRWSAGGPTGDAPSEAEEERVRALRRELDETTAALRALEARQAGAARSSRGGTDAPGSGAAAPGNRPSDGPRTDARGAASGAGATSPSRDVPDPERARKVGELVALAEETFAGGDGGEVLDALRRLADLVPEGREAAMALAVRVNDDVRGAGNLGIDRQTFYLSLGDAGLLELQRWALTNPSPASFRILAAHSLPWTLPRAEAVRVLDAALAAERDVTVQTSLVGQLAGMNDTGAEKALAAVFADRSRESGLRVQVATALCVGCDDAFAAALAAAAGEDPDERVRTAAAAALAARSPSADGYLVVETLPGGAAAAGGLRGGDVVVFYDGVAVRTAAELGARTQAAEGKDAVPVVVRRGEGETTLAVRGGPLGVVGRPVRKR